MQININEAETRLAELGELAWRGEEIIITKAGKPYLPLTLDHGYLAGNLPLLHRDPFDRMLIAQAQAESLILVTDDAAVQRYDVATLAA